MSRVQRKRIGNLLVVGGAEDRDEDNLHILPHFVEMLKHRRPRVVVCTAASTIPDEVQHRYDNLLHKSGAGEVYYADIRERADAENPEILNALRKAHGVYYSGGDQLRLTELVAGTSFGDLVRERWFGEGFVIGGTSAGAAAMSGTMVIGGKSGGTVKRKDVKLAPGLGYWHDAFIDTHFNQRGRVNRAVVVFSHNPDVLGIGIDEDTAVEVIPGKRFTVLGSGVVMVFDGRVKHTNAAEVNDDEPLALIQSNLHVLPEGYGYNLQTKRAIIPKDRLQRAA